MADEMKALEAEGVGHRDDVADQSDYVVVGDRLGAGTRRVSALVGRDGAVAGRTEGRELVLPLPGGLGEAVAAA